MKLLLALFAAAVAASPASSHWQFTRWGMTPEQVMKASPVPAKSYSDPQLDTSAETTKTISNYTAIGFDFVAMFKFSRRTGGLSRVSLMLRDKDQCGSLGYELRRIYGQPSSVLPLGVRQWRDEKEGNIVSLVPLAGCFLEYTEIPQGNTGL
jgi:hypothetical protein